MSSNFKNQPRHLFFRPTYYLSPVTSYLLLVTCYLLLVTCYLLLVTCYLLLVTCYLLLVTCYLLLVTCYLLLVTCYFADRLLLFLRFRLLEHALARVRLVPALPVQDDGPGQDEGQRVVGFKNTDEPNDGGEDEGQAELGAGEGEHG